MLHRSCESGVKLRQTAVGDHRQTAITRLEPAAVGPGDHLTAGTGAASTAQGSPAVIRNASALDRLDSIRYVTPPCSQMSVLAAIRSDTS